MVAPVARFETVVPGSISRKDRARLDAFYRDVQKQVVTFAGYPVTAEFDYRELFRFLYYPLNKKNDFWVL